MVAPTPIGTVLARVDAIFEAGKATARDAEQFEKFVVEGLGFTALVMCVFPFVREFRRSRANVVPIKTHREVPNLALAGAFSCIRPSAASVGDVGEIRNLRPNFAC